MSEWWVRGERFAGPGLPRKIMGVVNVTPDSFSDGGRFQAREAAIAQALRLEDEGADLIDIGGESSRPGASPVALEEERRRVLPVLEALNGRLAVPLSIDTMKPEIARDALAAGAAVVNDIGGLRDPRMIETAVETKASVILMHMAGTPQTMHLEPHYTDVVGEVRTYLGSQVDRSEAAGIPRTRIAIDPGIGFGKTNGHSLALLRELPQFASVGCVMVVGLSRKGLIGKLTGRPIDQRFTGSVVGSLAALVLGAQVVRVHDVAAMRDAIRVWDAVVGWTERGS
jgi:dihydropteroate synthase